MQENPGVAGLFTKIAKLSSFLNCLQILKQYIIKFTFIHLPYSFITLELTLPVVVQSKSNDFPAFLGVRT